MSPYAARRLAWALGIVSGIVVALSLSIVAIVHFTVSGAKAYEDWGAFALIDLVFAAVGTLVATRRPDHTIGWFFASIGLMASLQLATGEYAFASIVAFSSLLPGGAVAAWLSQEIQIILLGMLAGVLLLLPTGRLLTRRWRFAAGSIVAGTVLALSVLGFAPGMLEDFSVANPFGISGMARVLDIAGGLGIALFLFGVLSALASLLVRFRRARGLEREQIKWFAYAATLAVAAILGGTALVPKQMNGFVGELVWTAASLSLPVVMAYAILRYRLYDIDLIIRRTLIYGVLTAALALVYFGSVVLLQAFFRAMTGQAAQSQLAIVASTLAMAALFAPLRRRTQDVIDRRFYRRKYDAAKTLADFSATVRDEVELDKLTERLAQVVEETMQPAYMSLWLRPERNESKRGS